jgi:hypothetical protein
MGVGEGEGDMRQENKTFIYFSTEYLQLTLRGTWQLPFCVLGHYTIYKSSECLSLWRKIAVYRNCINFKFENIINSSNGRIPSCLKIGFVYCPIWPNQASLQKYFVKLEVGNNSTQLETGVRYFVYRPMGMFDRAFHNMRCLECPPPPETWNPNLKV